MLKTLYSNPNEVFLHLLRETRASTRLRQSDLAARLELGQATVSKVERGERRLDVMELRAWLTALGIDFVSFMAELDRLLRLNPIAVVHHRGRSRRVVRPQKTS